MTLSAWILILTVTLADGKATTTLQAFGNQPDCAAAAIEAVADSMATAARITVSCKVESEITEADLLPHDQAAPAHPSAESQNSETAAPAPDLKPGTSPGQTPSHDRNL